MEKYKIRLILSLDIVGIRSGHGMDKVGTVLILVRNVCSGANLVERGWWWCLCGVGLGGLCGVSGGGSLVWGVWCLVSVVCVVLSRGGMA